MKLSKEQSRNVQRLTAVGEYIVDHLAERVFNLYKFMPVAPINPTDEQTKVFNLKVDRFETDIRIEQFLRTYKAAIRDSNSVERMLFARSISDVDWPDEFNNMKNSIDLWKSMIAYQVTNPQQPSTKVSIVNLIIERMVAKKINPPVKID